VTAPARLEAPPETETGLDLGSRLALAGLVLVAGLAWLHLWTAPPAAPGASALVTWAAGFAMWTVMMAAMMIPTALPVLRAYALTQRSRGAAGVIAFAAGYLLAWTGFAAAATTAQPVLGVASCHAAGLAESDPRLAAALLVAVGIYQWTPLKAACLRQCQSPIGFLLSSWRSGVSGALRMGLRHGIVCVGCCFALMALMFVGGVMSFLWMAGLTALVLAEKLAILTPARARALGTVFVVAGVGLAIVR
jgi:predicted metal-binding membrane protein